MFLPESKAFKKVTKDLLNPSKYNFHNVCARTSKNIYLVEQTSSRGLVEPSYSNVKCECVEYRGDDDRIFCAGASFVPVFTEPRNTHSISSTNKVYPTSYTPIAEIVQLLVIAFYG